jgi:hypothetical protein
MFRSAGCSFLRAEGFSRTLCVLYGGLGVTKLQFFIKKISNFFSAAHFFQFWVNKTLDSELNPDPQLGKMLDPDPDPH